MTRFKFIDAGVPQGSGARMEKQLNGKPQDFRKNYDSMKKTITALLVLIVPCIILTSGKPVSQSSLMGVIREFNGRQGFEIVKIGSLGTGLLKTIMKYSDSLELDSETRQAMDVIKDVKSMAVVEYENCSPANKEKFNSRMRNILKDSELLMEVNDGGETLEMYGVMDEDSSVIRDFVMFSPDECVLVCMFGSISIEAAMKLAEQ